MNYKNILTEGNLRKWYWDEGLSQSQIAEQVGCDGVTVSRWMKRRGILTDLLRRGRHNKWGDTLTKDSLDRWYRDERLTVRQIAARIGCTEQTVRTYMDRYGILRRNRAEARLLTGGCFDSVLTKEFLMEKYWDKKHTAQEIANRVGCGKRAVLRNMAEHSIPRRTASEVWGIPPGNLTEANLRGLYWDERLAFSQIAERLGCCKTTVRNYMSEYGILSRTGSEARALASISGEDNPNWRGGTAYEPYPWEFDEAFKRKIKERDDYTCAICGKHWEEGNHEYHVHHINYVKADTTPENCITLCPNCHSKTNGDRDYWQKVLTRLIWATAGQAVLPLL